MEQACNGFAQQPRRALGAEGLLKLLVGDARLSAADAETDDE
jgi:hypothetical protein